MKEKAIFFILLIVMVYGVQSCEEEPEYAQGRHISEVDYALLQREPYIMFWQTNDTNCPNDTNCLEIIDFNFVIDPNEASYKAWLGWE